ncbi:MAG TPA: hypothetical protein VN420_01900 [Candidatus Fimivivens sp.]|nr:hypothetical protein [Candidatus Fimivivens sp.]
MKQAGPTQPESAITELQKLFDEAFIAFENQPITPGIANLGGAEIPTHVGGIEIRTIQPGEDGYTLGNTYLTQICNQFREWSADVREEYRRRGVAHVAILPLYIMHEFFRATGKISLRPTERDMIMLSRHWKKPLQESVYDAIDTTAHIMGLACSIGLAAGAGYLLFWPGGLKGNVDYFNALFLNTTKVILTIAVAIGMMWATNLFLGYIGKKAAVKRFVERVFRWRLGRFIRTESRYEVFRTVLDNSRYCDESDAYYETIAFRDYPDGLERTLFAAGRSYVAAHPDAIGIAGTSYELSMIGWKQRRPEFAEPTVSGPCVLFYHEREHATDKRHCPYGIVLGTIGELSKEDADIFRGLLNNERLV